LNAELETNSLLKLQIRKLIVIQSKFFKLELNPKLLLVFNKITV